MKALIQQHSNAKRFLRECNQVAILAQYRGAALKQCRRTRSALLDEILRREMAR